MRVEVFNDYHGNDDDEDDGDDDDDVGGGGENDDIDDDDDSPLFLRHWSFMCKQIKLFKFADNKTSIACGITERKCKDGTLEILCWQSGRRRRITL